MNDWKDRLDSARVELDAALVSHGKGLEPIFAAEHMRSAIEHLEAAIEAIEEEAGV